jgi:hypothetical protein
MTNFNFIGKVDSSEIMINTFWNSEILINLMREIVTNQSSYIINYLMEKPASEAYNIKEEVLDLVDNHVTKAIDHILK